MSTRISIQVYCNPADPVRARAVDLAKWQSRRDDQQAPMDQWRKS